MDDVTSSSRTARETWAAGDWESCAGLISPVGGVVIARLGVAPGMRLLDVGTGSGGNVAIPAARLGADVVGLDVTPELLVQARRHARAARVSVEWVEGDAQRLPFADAGFDRVSSTFGAMFAPDHERAAAELVRVCRPGGQIAMTTWVDDGFVGELFTLTGSFTAPPAPGRTAASRWGQPAHIADIFGAVDVEPSVERATVEFTFASVAAAVEQYTANFGPLAGARAALEPDGRWNRLVAAFGELVERFNVTTDESVRIRADYLLIHITRPAPRERI